MVENGVGKEFLYYNGELLAESNPLGNVVSRYILGYGVSAGWNREKSGYHYYHLDEQNSTAYITGGSCEIENRYEYDAFGVLQNSREELPNRILYTGQQYDQTSGQYYLRARFYNPVIGRFVQEDVYCGDGLNLYAYCKNNPVVYYDPSGYGEEKCDKVGGNDSKSGSSSLQDIANKAAQEYNAKYNPYERAISKGYTDVKKTANGGVSFQGSEYMYYHNGQEARKVIQATGNRNNDFKMANQAMRLLETPDGYVWHHLDDYNVEKNTITMELVMDEAHNASKPHSGGCAQYDSVNGSTYNKKRR